MQERNGFGHGFLVPLLGALMGVAACGAEGDLDTRELDELEPTPLDDAIPIESPEASESLGALDEVSEGLGTSATGSASAATMGRKVIFAFGKAAPDNPPAQQQLMRDSVAAVVNAYTSIAGESFAVHQSTDANVVSGAWVRSKLASFKTLGAQDTFVFYAHTHGTDARMMAGPLPNGAPDAGLTWSELARALLDIPAKNVVVFMMSCHSGRLVEQFDALASQWAGRRSAGRNLVVLSAVNATEVATPSREEGIGNPFTYAVAAATRSFVGRTVDRPYDGADGYSVNPQDWDGGARFSANVSFGELAYYVPDIATWAYDHEAYYAYAPDYSDAPVKHPRVTGSYDSKAVFIQQPGILRRTPRAGLPGALVREVATRLGALVDATGQRPGTAPGGVVGIVAPGYQGVVSAGIKKLGVAGRVDGDTFFQLGSVSKIFVGIALAHEVQRSAMSLDAAAARYLAAPLGGSFSQYATLRSLITHTAGFASMPDNVRAYRDLDGDGASDSAWWAPARNYEREHLVACLRSGGCRPSHDDGRVGPYQYSNLGNAMAGLAVVDALGLASFADLLRVRFVATLGMGDTGTNEGPFAARMRARAASPHGSQSGEPLQPIPYADMGTLAGAGEIITTANDMLVLLDQLAGVRTSSLTAAIVRATSPLHTIDAHTRIGYAIECDVAEPAVCSKPGATAGFTTFVIWRRDLKLGAVVMVNGGSVREVGQLGRDVLALAAASSPR